MGRGEREERGSKYNVCNFYRFIQVESGIRGKKKRKKKARKGGRESARKFGEEKERKKSGEKKPLSGRKEPLIARATS